jgi:hypothetical protein
MTMEALRRALINPWPALLSAGLIAGQSVRTRGVRRTALFAALGLGLPALPALLGPVSARPGPGANGARTREQLREQLTRLCSTGSTMDDYWGGPWRHEWGVQ